MRRVFVLTTRLKLGEPVRLEFLLSSSKPAVLPRLDSYRLSFDLARTMAKGQHTTSHKDNDARSRSHNRETND